MTPTTPPSPSTCAPRSRRPARSRSASRSRPTSGPRRPSRSPAPTGPRCRCGRSPNRCTAPACTSSRHRSATLRLAYSATKRRSPCERASRSPTPTASPTSCPAATARATAWAAGRQASWAPTSSRGTSPDGSLPGCSSRTSYTPGSTDATDDALAPLQYGLGVCRDYAHLTVTLLRALGGTRAVRLGLRAKNGPDGRARGRRGRGGRGVAAGRRDPPRAARCDGADRHGSRRGRRRRDDDARRRDRPVLPRGHRRRRPRPPGGGPGRGRRPPG